MLAHKKMKKKFHTYTNYFLNIFKDKKHFVYVLSEMRNIIKFSALRSLFKIPSKYTYIKNNFQSELATKSP